MSKGKVSALTYGAALLMLLGAVMLVAGVSSVIPFGAIASGAALLIVVRRQQFS